MNRAQHPERLDLIGALQGYYAAEALLQLQRAGVLEHLIRPISVGELSSIVGVRKDLLSLLLQFLTRTTDFIRATNGRYILRMPYHELYFQIEKFAGGYGPAARMIAQCLHQASRSIVDEHALARAFAAVEDRSSPIKAAVQRVGVRCLLDLGCGPAWLLLDLASANAEFEGYGVEASRSMCSAARQKVREAGLSSRIHIRKGDGRRPEKVLSVSERHKIDAIYGRSFLNEFFANGDDEVVAILRHLKRLFPGRIAWFADYYGELGRTQLRRGERRLSLLQDFAQAVSLQGVPPGERKHWQIIYERSACQLIEDREYKSKDIRWFIHCVQF